MLRKLFAAGAAVAFTVAVASPVRAVSNDTYRSKQWGLDRVEAEAAWARSTGVGALVAVVDTGVDLGHPDLAANLVTYRDADFVDPKGSDGAQDQNGHGTHVAGIIAAVANNGAGVAGVAPGAKILPVRVLDAKGSGTTTNIAAGVRYAADKGAKVINLSLGITSGVDQVAKIIGAVDPIYAAFRYAVARGATIVVAAGNDTFPLCAEPAGSPDVLCVGSTDVRDLPSFFSNHDATTLRTYVTAPGGDAISCAGDVLSTYLRSAPASACRGIAGGYEYLAGTSMATPFVSGIAALLVARGASRATIMSTIPATADDLGAPGRDPVYGSGRVNARKAVAAV